MGGRSVLAELRADPVTASVPVVILSADATKGQRQGLLDSGADAYLTKPFDVDELLRLLDDTFGSPEP
jgi:CheY-like chemotaxis protein